MSNYDLLSDSEIKEILNNINKKTEHKLRESLNRYYCFSGVSFGKNLTHAQQVQVEEDKNNFSQYLYKENNEFVINKELCISFMSKTSGISALLCRVWLEEQEYKNALFLDRMMALTTLFPIFAFIFMITVCLIFSFKYIINFM